MSRMIRSPKSPSRFPHFPYRQNPPWPHESQGEIGELILDAVSGMYFPRIYAVEGPYGLVDGRNGAVVDLDIGEHEAVITQLGPLVPPRP